MSIFMISESGGRGRFPVGVAGGIAGGVGQLLVGLKLGFIYFVSKDESVELPWGDSSFFCSLGYLAVGLFQQVFYIGLFKFMDNPVAGICKG